LKEEDTVAPDDTEMLRRILEKYRPVHNGGEILVIVSRTLFNFLIGCITLVLKHGGGCDEELSEECNEECVECHNEAHNERDGDNKGEIVSLTLYVFFL
jgi:hypothetical protein